jgi:hypothetical protein
MTETATEPVRPSCDDTVPRYDRQMGFFARVLFAGGREWVCSHAQGDVHEVALRTGRNLRRYPKDVRLTGIEPSPGIDDDRARLWADHGSRLSSFRRWSTVGSWEHAVA